MALVFAEPELEFEDAHDKRVMWARFHPTASNVLISHAADKTVKVRRVRWSSGVCVCVYC